MPSHRTLAPRQPGPAPRAVGVRSASVVGVASALVALGVTGAGLLVPAGQPASPWRVLGAVVAIAAAGVLVRTEAPSRAATGLATVSVVALAVSLATTPASPVTAPWASLPDPRAPSPPPEGRPHGRDVVIGPGAGEGAGARGGLALPPGADVVVDQGAVVLVLPDGGRIVIGDSAIDGADVAVPREGSSVTVVGGTAGRADGGPLGPDVGLGGLTIERGDGSRLVVGDGSLIEVPPPLGSDDPDSSDHVDALLAVLLGAFALLAFAPPMVRFSERAGVSIVTTPDGAERREERSTPTVEEGLADVLRSMLSDPDPRTSVIGAYARLLTALAEAGYPRRDEEGPHEHLWRSLGPLGVRRQPVHRLAELFVRARFTPRPVTEEDRQSAIAALADTVADLRLQALDVREVVATVGLAR